MNCYLCESEAVSRCYTCGKLVCANHGGENCRSCSSGVVAGDPRPDRITAARRGKRDAARNWWQPQPAADFEPPSCYECGGLTRRVCRNCRSHYCHEHAGPDELCLACVRSSRLGLVILVVVIATLFAIMLIGPLLS